MYSKKTSEPRVSLALRLAGLLAFTAGVCLAITFVLIYFVISAKLHHRIDDKLRHEAAEIAFLVSVNSPDALRDALRQAAYAEGTGKVLYRVLDARGGVRMESDTTGWKGVGIRNEAVAAAQGQNPVFDTVGRVGSEEETRVIYAPFTQDTTLQIALRVAQETQLLDDLKHLLLAGGAIGLCVSTLAGWLFSLRALSPLQIMTNTALGIADGDFEKRMQTSFRTAELYRLASAFNSMLDRIQSFVRELRNLNDSIAHDVRTALARTHLAAQRLLATAPLTEEQESLAMAVVENSDAMLGMMNTVLDLSELNTGIARTKFAPIDLNEVTADLFEFFEIAAEEKHIEMNFRNSPEAIVQGDRNRLRRALANLFDNAIKYTGHGGRVEVAVQADAETVSVSVADTGIGIPSEGQHRIFDRFYRVDSSRTGSGHGLGLSLASAVARLHGGSIQVQSTEGKGSTFTVTLPRSAQKTTAN